MYTEQIIDLVERYGMEMQPGDQFFTRAILSNNQIVGAIKTFAKGVNPDAIIGMIDDSLKKDGTEGILFTTSCIYFSNVDVQGMSMKNVMVRYCDICGAEIVTDKISDYTNVVQLDICNLPYENYRLDSLTFKKNPFKKLIVALVEMQEQEDIFEKDDKPSYSVVIHYLYQKDKIMKGVLDKIHSKAKLDTRLVSVTDAFGLTPLHYCIAFQDIDNAYRILKETLKNNKDMYVCRQPKGIYNYCMNVVMSGCGLYSNMGELFVNIFRCTDDMRALDKQLKKEQIKETAIEVGKAIFNEYVFQMQEVKEKQKQIVLEAIANREDEINRRKEKINSVDITLSNYAKIVAVKDEIRQKEEELKRKKEEFAFIFNDVSDDESEDNCFIEDASLDNFEHYEMIDYENGDDDSYGNVEQSGSGAIIKQMAEMSKEHFKECKGEFLRLKQNVDTCVQLKEEPRTPVILNMFENEQFIEKRLEAISCESVILRIKAKYFMVPKYFLEIYPHLNECIAVF